jgi:hypothetical protein
MILDLHHEADKSDITNRTFIDLSVQQIDFFQVEPNPFYSLVKRIEIGPEKKKALLTLSW